MLRNIPGIFLQDRDLPLILHHPAHEKVFLRFKLAEGLKPVYFSSAVKGEGSCGSLWQTWDLKDGALEMELQAAVPKNVISAADYPSFRKLATLAQAQVNRTVIFE